MRVRGLGRRRSTVAVQPSSTLPAPAHRSLNMDSTLHTAARWSLASVVEGGCSAATRRAGRVAFTPTGPSSTLIGGAS